VGERDGSPFVRCVPMPIFLSAKTSFCSLAPSIREMMPSLPKCLARSKDVLPSRSAAAGSAPAYVSCLHAADSPLETAQCSGVQPILSGAITSAPAAISFEITSWWLS